MKCNKCGFENFDDAKFCSSCGEKLVEDNSKKFCSMCGAENPSDASFCSRCGSSFKTGEPKVETVQAEFGNTKKCRICGHENEPSETYCKLCGSQLDDKPNYSEYSSSSYGTNNVYVSKTSSSSAGLVLGIVSIVSSITCCLFLVGVITGIIGIVVSARGLVKNKNGNKTKDIVGLILSILGLLIGVYWIVMAVITTNDPNFWEEYEKILEEYEKQLNGSNGTTEFKLFR